ncbi:MAG: helix-turn-helix transcriptional regulator [Bacteroidota bacterium]|nr:helix-turn-helix transcriptional regulator [Bacteroidota bacterium]
MKGKGKSTSKSSQKEVVRYQKQLGERIKALRFERGYTSYEYFAYDHNISRTQFGRYEKGQDLRFSSLVKITKAFGISFSNGFD